MLKIKCKGKRTVGKANKDINGKKLIIGLKSWKENSTELQKPNVEAEFCNNNKKCDWGKKKKLKSLIGFHSANKIDNYNRWETKNLREYAEQMKTWE